MSTFDAQEGFSEAPSPDVPPTFLRDLLVKRNLAEQSKWLNDPDPKPWATHPMQTVAGLMQWQMNCLGEMAPDEPPKQKPHCTVCIYGPCRGGTGCRDGR